MLKVRNFVPKSVLMLSATYSEFRKDLKQFLDQVITNVDTLIIHRGSGKAVVVMSLEEYNALCATSHELSSIKNKARLDASIQQIGANMIDFIPEWISVLPQLLGMTTNLSPRTTCYCCEMSVSLWRLTYLSTNFFTQCCAPCETCAK